MLYDRRISLLFYFICIEAGLSDVLSTTSDATDNSNLPPRLADPLKVKAPGYSLFFDGQMDYFYTDSMCWTEKAENITLSAWIQALPNRKSESFIDGINMHIFGHPTDKGSRMVLSKDGDEFRGSHASWSGVYGIDCSATYKLPLINLNDAQWHHVAMTANRTHKVTYVDHVMNSLCVRVENGYQPDWDTESHSQDPRIHLGMYRPKVTSNAQGFLGRIDEVVYTMKDASAEELKMISQGNIPERMSDSDNLCIHSNFDNTTSLGISSNNNMEWVTKSGRSPRYEVSNANVSGKMIVTRARGSVEGAPSPVLNVKLDSITEQLLQEAIPLQLSLQHDSDIGSFSVIQDGETTEVFGKSVALPLNISFVPNHGTSSSITIITLSSDSEIYNIPEIKIVFEVVENNRPIAGTGGRAIRCDGKDDYLFTEKFRLPVQNFGDYEGTGPVTIEFWSMKNSLKAHDGAMLSIGNGEQIHDWNDGRNPYAKTGLFVVKAPNEVGDIEGAFGSVSRVYTPALDTIGQWTHFAITHEGASGTKASIYINGKLKTIKHHNHIALGQTGLTNSIRKIQKEIRGLSVCAWTFWSEVYHVGDIDELRIWNRTLSSEEISSKMNERLDASEEEGLMAYYTFDEDKNVKQGVAPDSSGNKYDLIYGGCAPCADNDRYFLGYEPAKYPKNGCVCSPLKRGDEACMKGEDQGPYYRSDCGRRVCKPSAKSKKSPRYVNKEIFGGYPCYYMSDNDRKLQNRKRNSRWPTVITSTAPIRGKTNVQLARPWGSDRKNYIFLNGSDPDPEDALHLTRIIASLPKKGELQIHEINGSISRVRKGDVLPQESNYVLYVPEAGVGGVKIDSFEYFMSDGILESEPAKVDISVACPRGHFVNQTSQLCEQCPVGTYRRFESIATSCRVCKGNKVQSSTGQYKCIECDSKSTPNLNRTLCMPCSEDFKGANSLHVVQEHSCPILLNNSMEYSMAIRINDSIIYNKMNSVEAPSMVFLTALPSPDEATISQFEGWDNDTAIPGERIARTEGIVSSQFAERVLDTCGTPVKFEEQTSKKDFGILSEPDLLNQYGENKDRSKAWGLCRRPNGHSYMVNTITLQYKKRVIIVGITLYENYLPGGVSLVEAWNPDTSEWSTLWANNPHHSEDYYSIFGVEEVCSNFVPTDTIRLTLQKKSDTVSPPQLDAVKIKGVEKLSQVPIGIPLKDKDFRFVYHVRRKDNEYSTSLNYIHRRCTSTGATTKEVNLALSFPSHFLAKHKGGNNNAFVGMVCTCIPILFMLVVFIVLYNHQQRRKRKILQSKIEQIGNKIPASVLLDSSDVVVTSDVIGHDGSGLVYLATFRGMRVALKQLARTETQAGTSQAVRAEVEFEAKRMLQFRHPNIVIFMGCCLDPNNYFIISQYCERGSLKDILRNTDIELSWVFRLRLAVGAARGLAYLHSASPPFIHNDMKSLNILVDESWTAKLADFGTRRVRKALRGERRGTDEEISSTRGGDSVRWTAPEILLGKMMKGRGYSDRAIKLIQHTAAVDVYSMGVILWEIATREVPFGWLHTAHEVESEILSNRTIEFRGCTEEQMLPEGYEEIVKCCMAWEPEQRPTTIELLQQLEEMLESEEARSHYHL